MSRIARARLAHTRVRRLPRKSVDFVLVRRAAGGTLAAVLERSESIEQALGAVFTLAREESSGEVRVAPRVASP
jgi:hypothetical protein